MKIKPMTYPKTLWRKKDLLELQKLQPKLPKKKFCKHEPSGFVCAVIHTDKGQCNKCKKCGEFYE